MATTTHASGGNPGVARRIITVKGVEIMDESHAEEVLNLEEASRYLRIKRRTLYSLAARGDVPAAKIGGQWRFRRSQLDGLFEESRPHVDLPSASRATS
jgi:excisionase family DNA binding protein